MEVLVALRTLILMYIVAKSIRLHSMLLIALGPTIITTTSFSDSSATAIATVSADANTNNHRQNCCHRC